MPSLIPFFSTQALIVALVGYTMAAALLMGGVSGAAIKSPDACEVTVQYPISHTQCQENINYGCFENNHSVRWNHRRPIATQSSYNPCLAGLIGGSIHGRMHDKTSVKCMPLSVKSPTQYRSLTHSLPPTITQYSLSVTCIPNHLPTRRCG
jgi:hypothetical protein